MIEYCSKRILTIALLTLIIVASIIFYIEETLNSTLRPPRPPFDITVPCTDNQTFRFLTSCQHCNAIDKKTDESCRKTGYRTRIICDDINQVNKKENDSKNPLTWVACDPVTFIDIQSERRSFIIFEVLIGCCGLASYLFVRRQHRRLDQRLIDRVNRQILSSN